MSRSAGAAAKLPGSERKQQAVQALAGSKPISELSARLGVSRKFVYAQRGKASDAHNVVENLNSRLRNYFTLRRHLGNPYLATCCASS
jgi:hypothetical protein